MLISENVLLKPYNTFGITATARYFSTFANQQELESLLADARVTGQPRMILGGGSNILLTKNYDGAMLKNEIKGITVVAEDNDYVYVKAGAGENWHGFVQYCIGQNLAGLENLSLIPGNVGASPMQNIGAYGVEIKDCFHELEAFHLHEKTIVKFNNSDCKFGYRESVFKHEYKNQFAIISVTYKLSKQPHFNTSYGAIEAELEHMGVKELSIRAISDAVINIRSSKLPNPAEIGNAGSFFKNPSIDGAAYRRLKETFPNVVAYPLPDDHFKLAAGWLIEQCGWKGYRQGDAGVHAKQSLVLVNYGGATGSEIYHLSQQVVDSVHEKFGVTLEREVNII
ncbi:UDP-N-acetylmuramate dehydrogenase [Chitinophaga jiangningensis]|uniref:UDP-N-acetylenolpyruvoylglucosamine reductase n=1 Tax=Chitinophaga jiangningensis TaxID=1419482 RepID=A0A1M6VFA8_9BACT|nr:UDP-N-acetylmuramate dehydrogenase [Chitinophaga jiangningensis]SHK80128.1 UDP-N-acetylmuramate dehydrogenase [Chitinophaga jiangningensis]